MTATLSDDGSHVTLKGRSWGETFPVSDLPRKLRLYEGLRDRKGGRYAAHYAPTVAALRRVSVEVGDCDGS